MIEAKGRNGTSGRPAGRSPGNAETDLPAQVSTDWINARATVIADDPTASPSERAAAEAIRDGLNDGPPPVVHGRVITGSYRAEEAGTNPRRRRSDIETTMTIPERPDGASSEASYPEDGRHN